MRDTERQSVQAHVTAQMLKCIAHPIWRDAIEGNAAVDQRTLERPYILLLQLRRNQDAGAHEIAVRKVFVDVMLCGVGKVVFTALFGTRMSKLVTELHL